MAERDDKESAIETAAVVQDLRSKVEDIDRKLQRLLNAYLDQDIEQEDYRTQKSALVCVKKELDEQMARLEQRRTVWLAPLKEWIKDAQKLGETVVSPELTPKKSFAQKICGSHLLLKNSRIEFFPQTQWATLRVARQKISENPLSFVLERDTGIEPVPPAWKASVLPLYESRGFSWLIISKKPFRGKGFLICRHL